MRLAINLASHPYENLRPFYSAAWAAALSLVALAALVVWNERQNRSETRMLTEQINRLDEELENLRQEQQELERWLRRPDVQAIRDRSAFLNLLIRRKSLSWTRMFMDLESILPERARLTAIQPSLNQSQQAELSLTVAASEMAPLVEFLKNLEASPQFGSPVVESQRFPTERTADGTISMELSTEYRQDLAAPPAESAEPRKSEPAAALAQGPAGPKPKEDR